jgi:hypothetical protein
MFQAAPQPAQNLYLVAGGKGRSPKLKGASNMNTNINGYEFAESTVATGVTLLVSAWFLVAAGAILTDPVSPYTQRPLVREAAAPASIQVAHAQAPRLLPAAMAVAPDARFTITVEAKRLKV